MLYLRWLETSRRHAGRAALYDGGRTVTFGELAALVDLAPVADEVVIARTGGVDFFVGILRAWRDRQAMIPIEHEAAEPVLKCQPPPYARVVKYTPGASGVPRAIFFNDAQILADADRLFVGMKLSTDVPNLAVISMAHSYGFSNIALQMLLNGVPVCVAAMPFPRVVEELFREHGPMVVPAVPSIWRAWHRAGILKNLPVKLAVSAGAPLALALEREVFESSGLKIRNFYGASECGGISFDLTDSPRENAENVGTVLPGVKVSTGEQGRLLVESDAVAIGYDESRSDDLLEGGRYLTRDIGFLDAVGKLHLSGNTGGAINVSGRKVSPAKVEAALIATGLLERVRVFGIPSSDPERFEEISAIYELKVSGVLDAVKSAAKLESWELPRHWHVDAGLWKLSASELRAMCSRR
jgi:acyl-coenzyme A synthetase/AMP-(fatty) acid ligase